MEYSSAKHVSYGRANRVSYLPSIPYSLILPPFASFSAVDQSWAQPRFTEYTILRSVFFIFVLTKRIKTLILECVIYYLMEKYDF